MIVLALQRKKSILNLVKQCQHLAGFCIITVAVVIYLLTGKRYISLKTMIKMSTFILNISEKCDTVESKEVSFK